MPLMMIVTAEPSGDQHAADLVNSLREKLPQLACAGVLGDRLRQQDIEEIAAAEQLAVMGFSDVIRAFPRILKIFYKIRNAILLRQPQAVLMVDAPSFNLRLARSLRRKGYTGKLIQYISPTVWAWGRSRKITMANTLDALLTIYPFEKAHFHDSSLRVEYVGNPLISQIERHPYHSGWRSQVGISPEASLISLFPGSRLGEIHRNLPLMLQAIETLSIKNHHVAISAAHAACVPEIQRVIKNASFPCYIIPASIARYELMKESRVALAKSGTVTLELALHNCPTVVMYTLTKLNQWIAQYLLRVNLPHYCIVNILAGQQVFPEFIANIPTARQLSQELDRLLEEGEARQFVLDSCQEVQQLLFQGEASENAAQVLAELLT